MKRNARTATWNLWERSGNERIFCNRQANAMVDAAARPTVPASTPTISACRACWLARYCIRPIRTRSFNVSTPSKARALDGVVAVVTGEDAPNKYGILPVGHDETALAVGKVRYVGDNVAWCAAINEEIAEQALELIEVEYEPLPAY